jgi:hypothetical protein
MESTAAARLSRTYVGLAFGITRPSPDGAEWMKEFSLIPYT